ncbi:MAG: ABC transporter substrate-binding protein [Dethiobacteria bacterium]|jgi:branched-chain amino acid transport system substrate-binding protein|nr:ABC transporter substrate-binding protein [Bacillota bacterium]NMD33496.1 ABC transporter substrate-binding protein [Bacillota bacterium]HOB29346.1 ABC transporter substrate-binding protein [Bacillota bacterium]HPZ41931.1 ABC transporter substrate-binding protein [Bacillota bacterium]HQD52862.1 ABC transporter substrate-binding protein [Bacillota bacterium]
MRKRIGMVTTVLICLALMLVTGCEPADSENTVKVGMVGPLTGGAASYGTSIRNGAELAFDEANESGELGDYTIKFIPEDTESVGTKAGNAFAKLIEADKVSVIIGGVLSAETLTGSDYVKEAKVPAISPSSTAVGITKGNPYLFRNCLSDELQGYQMAEYAVTELGLKKFAILYTNNDYGVSLKNAFVEKGNELAEVVIVETYMDGDENFKPQLTNIKDKNPDAIFIAGYYTEAAKIAQQALEMGLQVQFLGADGFFADELIKIGGDAVEGAYFTAGFFSGDPSPELQDFIKKYKERYKATPDMFAAHGYDAARMIIEVIKKYGPEPEQIRKGLSEIKDFPGVTGSITIDEDGDTIRDVYILQVKDGEFNKIR